jgi:hypothetical protein
MSVAALSGVRGGGGAVRQQDILEPTIDSIVL